MVDATGVHVRLTGWAAIFGFARRIDLSADEVVSARLTDWKGVVEHFGPRLLGAYLPRKIAGGWFLVRRGRWHVVWCWLHRKDDALLIGTSLFRPGEVAVAGRTVTYAAGSEWFSERVKQ